MLLVDGVQLLPHLLGEEAGVVQVDIGLGLDVLSQRLFALLGLWQAVLQGRVVVRVEPGLDGGGGGSSGGSGGGGGTRPLAPLPTLRTVHAWLGEVGVLDEGALDLALAADDAGQTGALLGGVGGPEGVCSGGGEGLEVWRGQRRGVDGGRRGWQLGGGGGRWVRCRGAWGEWCTAQGRACLVGHRHERARRESTGYCYSVRDPAGCEITTVRTGLGGMERAAACRAVRRASEPRGHRPPAVDWVWE